MSSSSQHPSLWLLGCREIPGGDPRCRLIRYAGSANAYFVAAWKEAYPFGEKGHVGKLGSEYSDLFRKVVRFENDIGALSTGAQVKEASRCVIPPPPLSPRERIILVIGPGHSVGVSLVFPVS